jgi:peptide/nickel transport system permease protein
MKTHAFRQGGSSLIEVLIALGLVAVTMLGLLVPGLIGGSVIFETIFAWPGIGRLGYEAILSRDYPVVMGILVIGAVLTLIGNLLADVSYALADPRIRIS